MYIGRIVAIARTRDGRGAALYRVSSRSFPNRMAQTLADGKTVAIIPKPGFENDIHKNPYIAYNCLRFANRFAIVTNGSHTDPIAIQIEKGIPPRDALANVMLNMDFEHDSLDTPRISAVITPSGDKGWLGIVRRDALLIREFNLNPGQAYYISTYEKNRPSDNQVDNNFTPVNAQQACDFILGQGVFAEFEKPVTAVCAVAKQDGTYEFHSKDC